jgi:hypothetical protein
MRRTCFDFLCVIYPSESEHILKGGAFDRQFARHAARGENEFVIGKGLFPTVDRDLLAFKVDSCDGLREKQDQQCP